MLESLRYRQYLKQIKEGDTVNIIKLDDSLIIATVISVSAVWIATTHGKYSTHNGKIHHKQTLYEGNRITPPLSIRQSSE